MRNGDNLLFVLHPSDQVQYLISFARTEWNSSPASPHRLLTCRLSSLGVDSRTLAHKAWGRLFLGQSGTLSEILTT